MIKAIPLFGLSFITVAALGMTGCQTGCPIEECRSLRAQNTELQNELERTRAANMGTDNRLAALEAENRRLEEQLNSRPQPAQQAENPFDDIDGVNTTQGDGLVVVTVPGDVLFASGSVNLQNASLATLNQIADVLRERYPNNMIRIAGHTDTDPITRSNWDDNWQLSCERALSVLRHLASEGVTEANMYAAGYGPFQTRASKEESRRVEIIVELN